MYLTTPNEVKVLEINEDNSYNTALITKVPNWSYGIGLSYSEDEVLFNDFDDYLWKYVYF